MYHIRCARALLQLHTCVCTWYGEESESLNSHASLCVRPDSRVHVARASLETPYTIHYLELCDLIGSINILVEDTIRVTVFIRLSPAFFCTERSLEAKLDRVYCIAGNFRGTKISRLHVTFALWQLFMDLIFTVERRA